MEKKSSCARAGFSTILWGVLAILLCAVPCVWADVTFENGDVNDIDYVINGNVFVNDATVNLLSGAYITDALYANAGSTVNIYGGGVEWWVVVSPGAVVTVYGTDFQVNNGDVIQPPDSVTIPYGTLTGKYGDGSDINLVFMSDIPIYLAAPGGGVTQVEIDIKPGSYPNSINLGSNGVIPVAILSDPDFDATTVDPESVSLAGSGVAVRGKGNKLLAHEEDVNGDGLTDLVVKVETENLDPGTFQDGLAILTGETVDGVQFEGSDYIIIVPPEG